MPFVPTTQRKLALLLDDLSSTDEKASLLLEFPALDDDHARPQKRQRSVPHSEAAPPGPVMTPSPKAFTPFSNSSRWATQRRYYAERKMGAWDDGHVPCEISSNPFVAHIYAASLILPAITRAAQRQRDACEAVGSVPPPFTVRVVEVGAGHGRLSLLLARDLSEMLKAGTTTTTTTCGGGAVRCQVVCTDFHSAVLEEVAALPWAHQLMAAGALDFAVTGADAGTDGDCGLRLLCGGGTTRDEEVDLLVVVGNYCFDSLPVRLVVKSGAGAGVGAMHEVGVTPRRRGPIQATTGPGPAPRAAPEDYVARPMEAKGTAAEGEEDDGASGFFAAATARIRDEGREGTYVVPVGGATLLDRVKRAFRFRPSLTSTDEPHPVLLVVGDCVIGEDDRRWQASGFRARVSATAPHATTTATAAATEGPPVLPMPWFDPPLISPRPEVVAVPVNLAALDMAFCYVFGSTGGPDSAGGRRGRTLRCVTPLSLSSFTAATFSTHPWLSPAPAPALPHHPPTPSPSPSPSPSPHIVHWPPFGPHDYCVLQQLLSEPFTRAGAGPASSPPKSLTLLRTFVATVARADATVLLPALPSVLRHYKSAAAEPVCAADEATESGLRDWAALAVRCVRRHACTTWTSLQALRSSVARFLLALGCVLTSAGGRDAAAAREMFLACLVVSTVEEGDVAGRGVVGPVFAVPVPSSLRGALVDHALLLTSAGDGDAHTSSLSSSLCLRLVCVCEDEALACAAALLRLAPGDGGGASTSTADAADALLQQVLTSTQDAASADCTAAAGSQKMRASRAKHAQRLLGRARAPGST